VTSLTGLRVTWPEWIGLRGEGPEDSAVEVSVTGPLVRSTGGVPAGVPIPVSLPCSVGSGVLFCVHGESHFPWRGSPQGRPARSRHRDPVVRPALARGGCVSSEPASAVPVRGTVPSQQCVAAFCCVRAVAPLLHGVTVPGPSPARNCPVAVLRVSPAAAAGIHGRPHGPSGRGYGPGSAVSAPIRTWIRCFGPDPVGIRCLGPDPVRIRGLGPDPVRMRRLGPCGDRDPPRRPGRETGRAPDLRRRSAQVCPAGRGSGFVTTPPSRTAVSTRIRSGSAVPAPVETGIRRQGPGARQQPASRPPGQSEGAPTRTTPGGVRGAGPRTVPQAGERMMRSAATTESAAMPRAITEAGR